MIDRNSKLWKFGKFLHLGDLWRYFFFNIYFNLSKPFKRCFRTVQMQDKYLAQLNIVTEVHKDTFGKYKNMYNGQDIVIYATGPSLNKYVPIPNTVSIGVNKACLCDKITLDYFFASDYPVVKDYLDGLKHYKNKDLKIFLGVFQNCAFGFPEQKIKAIMPESKILELNAKKYYLYIKYPPYNVNFYTDIDKAWIVEGGSVIFAAMQFALFTNPKRIFLVGCDCSTGYFTDKEKVGIKPNKFLIKTWKNLKDFASTYYPSTEIISVNPVGLRGMFKDLDQEG